MDCDPSAGDQGSWTKKLAESRSAYTSLRDHFLKYINNPNDLHSSTDPLADDENSPWSSLRHDEQIREEIFQDVTRCMQENYFFREPSTQRKLLDVLFIYSKLNPDTGYRQGMHELLAPILWVVSQDVIETGRVKDAKRGAEGVDFMLEVLDKKFIEHDSFSMFCAVMQTAKSFYEIGDSKDSAAIVAQSNRIHYELLAAVDPELASHLQVVGVLPQIYSIRWIRLLFGREFDFKDVLKLWDALFAESLSLEIVDMTCVAMLLRMHWQLIDADYTMAITRLNKFQLPADQANPRGLVKDAIYLIQNKASKGGADIIQKHTGQRPTETSWPDERPFSPASPASRLPSRLHNNPSSPSRSPARFTTPQKQLESLFQEVSGTLQRRTEGWSKTVRGAVGEVKRNMNHFQVPHSRGASIDAAPELATDSPRLLQDRLRVLEKRNKALAKMLDSALEALRGTKPGSTGASVNTEDTFNMALARIQFVSVYLADAEIPIPSDLTESMESKEASSAESIAALEHSEKVLTTAPTQRDEDNKETIVAAQQVQPKQQHTAESVESKDASDAHLATASKSQSRPSLADSSFSFMLGENRKRSSFVTSASELPEQRRGSESHPKPKQIWTETKGKHQPDRRETSNVDDGFTLNSLG